MLKDVAALAGATENGGPVEVLNIDTTSGMINLPTPSNLIQTCIEESDRTEMILDAMEVYHYGNFYAAFDDNGEVRVWIPRYDQWYYDSEPAACAEIMSRIKLGLSLAPLEERLAMNRIHMDMLSLVMTYPDDNDLSFVIYQVSSEGVNTLGGKDYELTGIRSVVRDVTENLLKWVDEQPVKKND
jgi:hypothetical protein